MIYTTKRCIAGREMHIGCSIGIAMYPADGRDVDALLKNSDAALYAVKQDGRNGYRFFAPSLDATGN